MIRPSAPRPRVKVFGERNSGMNYLIRLLRLNTDAVVPSGGAPAWWLRIGRSVRLGEGTADWHFALTSHRNLGWKHRSVVDLIDDPPPGWSFVCLVKNPYSWLLSLRRRPYHNWELANLPLEDFVESRLDQPWRARERDHRPVDPVSLWNRRHREYLAFREAHEPVHIVRYEDLVADPEGRLELLAHDLGLGPLDDDFSNVRTSTKRDARDYESYRRYYGAEEWREELEPGHVSAINARLDRRVARELGYEIIRAPSVAGAGGRA